MTRINMTTVDYIINKKAGLADTKSNKNLTEDILIELADVIHANTSLLKEEFNPFKPYSFLQEDIPLIEEMITRAKTKNGKRLRCKDYESTSVALLEFYVKAFLTLYHHNGVKETVIEEEFLKILHQTEFILLIDKIKQKTHIYNQDLEEFYFMPNDKSPNEDDELTDTDKLVFLYFVYRFAGDASVKDIRGIYWLFVECRKSYNWDNCINSLHSMNNDEKENMVRKAFRYAKMELALAEDNDYCNTLESIYYIESGHGNLQDKRKLKGLFEKLIEKMDGYSDMYLIPEDYYDNKKEKDDDCDYSPLVQSQKIFEKTIRWYFSEKSYRKNNPITNDNKKMFEDKYTERFGDEMFEC